MIIHLNGLHPQRALPPLGELPVSWAGYVFDRDDPRYVALHHEHSGIVPDRAIKASAGDATHAVHGAQKALRAGWFTNTMPQTLITNVVQYELDVAVLAGEEKPLLIDNLRSTLQPELRPGLLFVKRIKVSCADDVRQADDYSGVADYLLFESLDAEGHAVCDVRLAEWLRSYRANVPYLVGGPVLQREIMQQAFANHQRWAGMTLHL